MRSLAAVLIACAVLALSGCAKARAATQPDLPALAPPAAPPRVVVPPGPEPEAPPAATQEPETSRPAVRRPQPRPEPPKTEPPKPVVPPPPVKEEPPPVTTTLQAVSPGGQADAERSAKQLLAQASGDLARVKAKYGSLNADGKAQYDDARRFEKQAQQALKEQNFAFAQRLAEKAATLASGLVGK